MEAVHFVEDLATGVELALVSPHPLDRRDATTSWIELPLRHPLTEELEVGDLLEVLVG